jgi:hypothetical protein
MMKKAAFAFLIGATLFAQIGAEACDRSCERYIEPAKRAVESCLYKMREFLAPELPEDADTAGVDVFLQGFVLGLSKGRIVRDGGESDGLRVYLVCEVDLNGDVVAGDFYPYDHWPPKSDAESFIRTVGPYIEHFYGDSRTSSYSQAGSAPLATLLFSIDGDDLLFSECIEVPEDWGD